MKIDILQEVSLTLPISTINSAIEKWKASVLHLLSQAKTRNSDSIISAAWQVVDRLRIWSGFQSRLFMEQLKGKCCMLTLSNPSFFPPKKMFMLKCSTACLCGCACLADYLQSEGEDGREFWSTWLSVLAFLSTQLMHFIHETNIWERLSSRCIISTSDACNGKDELPVLIWKLY